MGWCYLRNCADEFIEKFNPNQGQLNIKRHFLRLPVFVTNGLSLLFNIRAHSTQERLAALQQHGHLHPSFANALALLLQIGFYWRIKVHLHYGKECDTVALDQASGKIHSEDNLDVPNTHDFTLSTHEFNLFEPLYHEIMMVLEQCTRTFIAQANTSNSLQLSHPKLTHTPDAERAQAQHSKNTHRDNSTHVFQHTQITDLSTVYQNLGAEHFHQGRWPLALAYYQQALQLTQDKALAKQLRDWITNTKTLLEDHQSTMHAVLSALKKAQLPLENAQRGPTFAAPPESLWPESSVGHDRPYPDGLHGLHAHTLAWLRLGVSHLLALEDNPTAWQAFHTLRFALPSPPAVYALNDELTLWQQQATAQPSSIPQTHTAKLQQPSVAQTYTTRLQRLMAWQDAWPQPKGIRATLKDAWQDSWNVLEAMTEAYDPTQPKDALKKGRILLQWIKPNPLNPAEIGNLKTARLLKPELAQQLIDKHGHLLKKPLAAGQRLTYPLTLEGDTTPSFYAKVYPEFPGMQIVVDTLCALLSGASGNAILAHLYLPQKKGPLKKSRHFKPYPLLLSKSLGDTLQKSFASNTDLHSLDTYSFTWKLIETLLIHPEDDKPDNIALQSFTTPLGEPAYRLVSFDADHAFTEAVLEKKHPMRRSQELLVQLKSIVLCLNTMNHPLNPDAIAEFLSLDAASVLEQWLNHCHQFNHQLFKPEGLFSPDIMKTFYEHTSSPAFLPIAFVEGMIADLYQRWHRLRLALASQRFDSHHDLLAFVNPYLARFYHDAFTQHDTPDKRFHALPTDYKTIRDKTHDTLLYVTDTGVHQGTLRSLTVAHQKKDIKKDLKTVIEQAFRGEALLFQPKHALKELQTTLAHYQQFDQIQQDLRAGDFQRFAELKIHTLKQKLFNGLVWTHYSEAQQRTLLKAAEGTQFTKLKLINCAALTMDKLAKLLKKSHDLVRLEIVNNPHVDNTLGDILAKHNPALQRLYLHGLPKLTQVLTAVVNAIPMPYTQLTALVAEHCNIGATGATQIVKHLPYLKQLALLDLRNNHIPDKPMTALLDTVNTHLKKPVFKLALAGNEHYIQDVFLRELIAALGGAKTKLALGQQLTLLNKKTGMVSFNNKKLQLFIHNLWRMPQLQSLNLECNYLGDAAIKALAPYLKDCPNLQSLNLRYNDLRNAGMQILATHLKDCPNLNELNHYKEKTLGILMGRSTTEQNINLSNSHIDTLGIHLLALNLKHYPQLQSLNLNYNHLDDAGIQALASHLKHCSNLQSLNLRSTGLGEAGMKALAPHLKDCPNLQSLNLKWNNLRKAGMNAFATHLQDCSNLQSLNLGDNYLGEASMKALAPHLKHCPNLQSLDLAGNYHGEAYIKALAPYLKNCPNLQSLNLERNHLHEAGMKAFAPYLKDCPNLQSLNLRRNHLGDAGIQALAPHLKHCPNLQSLNLETNELGEAGIKTLAPHLKDCTNLNNLNHYEEKTLGILMGRSTTEQNINLSNSHIDTLGIHLLALNLKHYPQLQSLDLRRNHLGEAGIKTLAPHLRDCTNLNNLNHYEEKTLGILMGRSTTEQNINLSNSHIDTLGIHLLALNLKHYPQLQSLDLRRNHLGEAGIKTLAPHLKHCPNLQSLNLRSTGLGEAGIQALAPHLKHCPNLQSLNLRSTGLGEAGIQALAPHLKHCPNLQSLNLKWNNLRDDSMKALAPHLKHCPNLQSLNLGINELGEAGIQALAPHLKHCPNLQSLNLEGNIIGVASIKALTPHLKDCLQLQSLNLGDNYLGEASMKALAPHLKHCPNLQYLNLTGNDLGDAGLQALAPYLKHCPNLQSLNLKWNNLREDSMKALAPHLKHCPNLQYLNEEKTLDILMGRSTTEQNINLSNSHIDTLGIHLLALNLKHYPQLQSLDLRRNHLGEAGIQALAPHLKHCPNLQSLNLEGNIIGVASIKALTPYLKDCLQLQSLNLGDNYLGEASMKALAPHLKHCPNLQYLNLTGNNLGDAGLQALAPRLKDCPKLQSLDLRRNHLGEAGIKTLAPHLKHCPNLQSLNLRSTGLGEAGIQALAPHLKHCPNLQSLNLKWNNLRDDSMKALAPHLKHCPNLQSLNLGINELGEAGIQALAPHLKHCPNLQYLNLTGNNLGDAGLQALAPRLKDCPKLQSLDLRRNHLGEAGIKTLAPHLKHCPNLQSLNLRSTGLGEAGIQALAPHLKHCPNLQSLNLKWNNLRDDSMKALAPHLKHCPNLQSLNLGINELGEAGIQALAPHLKHCPNLQSLNLEGNIIGVASIKALTPHLKDCLQLQSLNLGDNYLGEASMKALAPHLKHCPNLQYLNLTGNDLGDAGLQALAPRLKDCPKLQSLNLRYNLLGDASLQALAPHLKNCSNLQFLHFGGNYLLTDAGFKALIPNLKNSSLQHLDYYQDLVSDKINNAIKAILTANHQRAEAKEVAIQQAPTTHPKPSTTPTIPLPTVANPDSSSAHLPTSDKQTSITNRAPSQDKPTTPTQLSTTHPNQLTAPQATPSHRHSCTNAPPSSFSEYEKTSPQSHETLPPHKNTQTRTRPSSFSDDISSETKGPTP